MNAALASSCSFSSTSDLHLRHHLLGHFHLRKWHNHPCTDSVKNPAKLPVLACAAVGSGGGEKEPERRTFLSLEEAGLVEMSGLDTHERFLCRLTISSLNLLKVISEQEGCSIEELNAGRVCDWFLKDKLKKEQNLGTAVLQWEDPGFQL